MIAYGEFRVMIGYAKLLCAYGTVVGRGLSEKTDRLSGRTNQRLPPGGSSRRSRVRESALR